MDTLYTALSDSNAKNRAKSAEALRRLAEQVAISHLLQAATDKVAEVQEQVAWALE